MKYKIIGWESCDNPWYNVKESVTAHVDEIIQEDIRKHGYMFGGDAHEEYCPVLNDGTLVSYSWRGWGGVMARAYAHDGDMAYMDFYMDQLIAPKKRKYPKQYPDGAKVVPTCTLAEKFEMHLDDEMFAAMKDGKKRVEFRLFDDKRKKIDIGDYIRFVGKDGSLLMRVVDELVENSFKKLYKYLVDPAFGNGFTAEELGFAAGTDEDSFEEAMSAIYPPAAQQGGVIALVLEKATPLYFVAFNVWTDSSDMVDRLLEIEDLLESPCFTDDYDIENALAEIAPFERFVDRFRRAVVSSSLDDALREALGELYGKQESLMKFFKQYYCPFSLDVIAVYPDVGAEQPVLPAEAEAFCKAVKAESFLSYVEL